MHLTSLYSGLRLDIQGIRLGLLKLKHYTVWQPRGNSQGSSPQRVKPQTQVRGGDRGSVLSSTGVVRLSGFPRSRGNVLNTGARG